METLIRMVIVALACLYGASYVLFECDVTWWSFPTGLLLISLFAMHILGIVAWFENN